MMDMSSWAMESPAWATRGGQSPPSIQRGSLMEPGAHWWGGGAAGTDKGGPPAQYLGADSVAGPGRQGSSHTEGGGPLTSCWSLR